MGLGKIIYLLKADAQFVPHFNSFPPVFKNVDFGNPVGLASYWKKKKKQFSHLATEKQSVVWVIFKKLLSKGG